MDRKSLEMLMLAALRKRNLAHAVDLAFTYGYRTAPTVNIGLDIWVKDAHWLELLFSNVPTLLATVPPDVVEQMRLIAGLLHLVGDTEPLQAVRLGNAHVPGTHVGSRWAPKMLLAHADFLFNLEQYRERANSRRNLLLAVRHSSDEFVCPACREFAKLRFRMDDIFELPNPLCTCEMGCRCQLYPVL